MAMDITISALASGTAHLVNMPATVESGDLLTALLCGQDQTVTTPTGWTALASVQNDAITRVSSYYKIADGTEDSTTVDFVTAGATKMVAHVWRTPVAEWHGTTPPEVATATSAGDTTTPNPPSLTPSWGSAATTWIALYGCVNVRTVSAYPASYTNGNDDNTTGGGGSNVSIGSALRVSYTATTEDPGTFTISASGRCVMHTIGIRPAVAPAAGGTAKDLLLLDVG